AGDVPSDGDVAADDVRSGGSGDGDQVDVTDRDPVETPEPAADHEAPPGTMAGSGEGDTGERVVPSATPAGADLDDSDAWPPPVTVAWSAAEGLDPESAVSPPVGEVGPEPAESTSKSPEQRRAEAWPAVGVADARPDVPVAGHAARHDDTPHDATSH